MISPVKELFLLTLGAILFVIIGSCLVGSYRGLPTKRSTIPLPQEMPADFSITVLEKESALSPKGTHQKFYLSKEKSYVHKKGIEQGEVVVEEGELELTEEQFQIIYDALHRHNFTKLKTGQKMAYDRGGIGITVRWSANGKEYKIKKSNSGIDVVHPNSLESFEAIIDTIFSTLDFGRL